MSLVLVQGLLNDLVHGRDNRAVGRDGDGGGRGQLFLGPVERDADRFAARNTELQVGAEAVARRVDAGLVQGIDEGNHHAVLVSPQGQKAVRAVDPRRRLPQQLEIEVGLFRLDGDEATQIGQHAKDMVFRREVVLGEDLPKRRARPLLLQGEGELELLRVQVPELHEDHAQRECGADRPQRRTNRLLLHVLELHQDRQQGARRLDFAVDALGVLELFTGDETRTDEQRGDVGSDAIVGDCAGTDR